MHNEYNFIAQLNEISRRAWWNNTKCVSEKLKDKQHKFEREFQVAIFLSKMPRKIQIFYESI